MIGSFPIHVAGLLAVIAGILLFVILSIGCFLIYGFMFIGNKKENFWIRALMRSAFLLAVLNILCSFSLMLIFVALYEQLANIFKFDFEKGKDLYDLYLSGIWIIFSIVIWIKIGSIWRNHLEGKLRK